jgi:hypothetical protein
MFEQQVGPGLYVKLGIKMEEFQFGLDKAKYAAMQWRDETNKGSSEMLKWGSAITATIAPYTAAAAAGYAIIEQYGGMANSLKDLSYQTGISTDQIQRLQYAATLSGTNFNQVAFAVNQLTLTMAEAKDPASAAYKAFMGLGINPNGKTPEQVFDATAKALVGMKNETERNQIAMAIYGRSWKELLPFMETYIEKAKEIREHPLLTEKEIQDLSDAKAQIDGLASAAITYAGKGIASVKAALDELKKGGGGWEFPGTSADDQQKIKDTTALIDDYTISIKEVYTAIVAGENLKFESDWQKGARELGLTGDQIKSLTGEQKMQLASGVIYDPKLYEMMGLQNNPTLNPAKPVAAPPNWLDQIGAKYRNGEITSYAPGFSKSTQDRYALDLKLGTAPQVNITVVSNDPYAIASKVKQILEKGDSIDATQKGVPGV